MDGRKNSRIPRRLARAAARFAAWRRSHEPHTRIPKFLWTAAVKLAAELGISYTATWLRLNYYDLKKHVKAAAPQSSHASGAAPPSSHASGGKQMPSFLELPAAALATSGECVIELENSAGSKMRIQVKGSHGPDLVALSAAFCNLKR